MIALIYKKTGQAEHKENWEDASEDRADTCHHTAGPHSEKIAQRQRPKDTVYGKKYEDIIVLYLRVKSVACRNHGHRENRGKPNHIFNPLLPNGHKA